jgi:hypothetical protein
MTYIAGGWRVRNGSKKISRITLHDKINTKAKQNHVDEHVFP